MSFQANWQGAPKFATRNQLLSSINGVYIDISGITIDASGIFISSGQLTAPFVSLSTLSFKGFDDLLDLDVSFDLGLGKALGGAVAGLGAAVGGAAIAVGTGAGLAISGAAQGLATMVAPRGQSFISQTKFETINFTTQLQVSTLGNAYPLYSTIFRTVSSVNAEEVPGREIFTSTFFLPGQICIRSASDPFNLITGDINLNTSSIQSFGQWVPFEGLEPDSGLFSSIHITASAPDLPFRITNLGENVNNDPVIILETTLEPTFIQSYAGNVNPLTIAFSQCNVSYNHFTDFNNSLTFLSSPFVQFLSTVTNDIGITFLPASVPNLAKFTYDPLFPGSFVGDFAICDPGEVNFRSTGTFDFITTATPMLVQWGLGGTKQASIASTSAIRLDFNNIVNTSNLGPIPLPVSTVVANSRTNYSLLSKPNEYQISVRDGTAPLFSPLPLAFDINSATFGSQTTFSNQAGYPYQFNGNLFVNGIVEADTLIALSSIFAVSTVVDTNFSTQSFEANTATILQGFISSLTANSIQATSLSSLTLATSSLTTSNVFATSLSTTNGAINNLTVQNLFATNLVYSNAEAPSIQTSTINFGWTGNFSIPTIPQFSLQQNLVTEPGLVYTNFSSASNQLLNIMNFSNTVFVQSQQFSTPLTDSSTDFSGLNIQGWASTIFFNNGPVGKQAILYQGSPPGEVSFQGQTNQVQAALNYVFNGPIPPSVTVAPGQTFKFTSDGSIWTTSCNAPVPGIVTYNNNMKLSMDFENTNLTTTDTFNITAEQINLNGVVNIQYPFFSNVYVDTFVSTSQLIVDSRQGVDIVAFKPSSISFANEPTSVTPMTMNFTVATSDFLTNFNLIAPFIGSNSFNSYNASSWNMTVWNNVVTAPFGPPGVFLGDVITPLGTYASQFYINNTIIATPQAIPIYFINASGSNLLGLVAGNTYGKIATTDGVTWAITSNVSNPQGNAGGIGATYSNIVTTQQSASLTQETHTQNYSIQAPVTNLTTNQFNLFADAIRVSSRARGSAETTAIGSYRIGIELGVYEDVNIIWTNVGVFWQSDATNAFVTVTGDSIYDVNAWSVLVVPSRFRTNDVAILSYDVQPAVLNVAGGGFCWGYSRYIQVAQNPGSGATNYNWYMAVPLNYITRAF